MLPKKLLLAQLLVAVVVEGGVEFAYEGFAAAGLALDGTASVTPDGLLLLTNDTNLNIAHAFHSDPVSTSGLAFLVAPTSRDLSTATAAQYLGMFNAGDNGDPRNHVFAVELDTVRNTEFEDMDGNHVGIDVNSLNSSAAATAGYYDDATGAFQNLGLGSRDPMQVWVDYDAATTEITVAMAPARSPRPERTLLSTRINLSTIIADTAYVGFSSGSSIVLCKNYVLGWSFSLDGGAAPALDDAKLPKLPRIGPKPRSKALAIVLPIITTAAVLAAVGVGLLLLRRRIRYAELREDWEVEFGPHRFAFKDLYDATAGFKDKRLLGTGGFGSVYMGVLPGSRSEIITILRKYEFLGIEDYENHAFTLRM
ncbi:hypothetical protein ACQ4PT_026517 [Festuca glaucescens]